MNLSGTVYSQETLQSTYMFLLLNEGTVNSKQLWNRKPWASCKATQTSDLSITQEINLVNLVDLKADDSSAYMYVHV